MIKLKKNDIKSGFTRVKLLPQKENTDVIINPYRGWYQIHYFTMGGQINPEEFQWSISRDDSLAFLFIKMGDYIDRPIDREAMDNLRVLLELFEHNSIALIVRGAYDSGESGDENTAAIEPHDISLVRTHLKQILEVLLDYRDSIYVFQGCLLGRWGEMHGSCLLRGRGIKELYNEMSGVVQNAFPIAFRRAAYCRAAKSGEECGKQRESDDTNTCLSVFDDALLGDGEHMGSFGHRSRYDFGTRWDEAWLMAEELEFIADLSRMAPVGGEAIYGTRLCRDGNTAALKQISISRMEQMGVSYLNRIHDAGLLDIWKDITLAGKAMNCWRGKSLYDYIGAHMGYRYVIDKVKCRFKNNTMMCNITITNKGFAPAYRTMLATLYAEDMEVGSAQDITALGPGETRELMWTVDTTGIKAPDSPAGESGLSLGISTAGIRVLPANKNIHKGRLLLGILN